MREYYEPFLDLSDPEHHSTMGAFLTLKDPVDREILRSAVDALRTRFPYFYVRAASGGKDWITVPNELPMMPSAFSPFSLSDHSDPIGMTDKPISPADAI